MRKNTRITIIFNASKHAKNAISNILNDPLFSKSALILDGESKLTSADFSCPVFFINDLVPTNSKKEEKIYQQCRHYRKFFIKKFPISFKGINLLEDEFFNHNFESISRYAKAYLSIQGQYNNIIIALSFEPSIYFNAITKLSKEHKLSKKQQLLNFNKDKNCMYTINFFYYTQYSALLNILNSIKKISCLIQKNTYLQNQSTSMVMPAKTGIQNNTSEKFRNPCLIMTTASPLYRNNFKPVYLKLCETLQKNPVAIAVTSESLRAVQEDNISAISLDSLGKLAGFSFFTQAIILFIKSFFIALSSSAILLNIRLKDPLRDTFRHQAMLFFAIHQLPFKIVNSFSQTKRMEQLFRKIKPDIIYKDVSKTVCDARIASLGKKYNIPVAASVVASITSSYRNFAIYPCDFITILGEEQRPIFKKFGYRDEQIISVGQPELDVAKQQWNPTFSHEYLIKKIDGYSPTVFTILIATSAIDRASEKNWIEIISEYANQREQPTQILIKPHPSVGNFYDASKRLKHINILPVSTELYPLLITANLVITDVSHAGKLAIFFRKPLMVVNFSGKKFPYNNFDVEGVAWLATNRQEIYDTIDGVISKKLSVNKAHYDAYIHQHLTSDDGKAADRIVDFLLQFS
jgi:hypothetical protein